MQRILNVLEVGIGKSITSDSSLIDEVLTDVELIVCQSQTAVLEEASKKCFCVVAQKAQNEVAIERAARAFQTYLDSRVDQIRGIYEKQYVQKKYELNLHSR